jgi:DNA-binding MarR family transcriptional regulator
MSSTKPGNDTHLTSCVGANIRRANRMVSQYYDDTLRPSGLRITQFSLLVRIRELGPVTMNHLAESAMMDRTTLTRNLRPLEREGLIAITPAQDRRKRHIALTKKGGEAMMRAFPFWKQAQQRLRDGLGESRFKRLLGDLKEAIRLAKS